MSPEPSAGGRQQLLDRGLWVFEHVAVYLYVVHATTQEWAST